MILRIIRGTKALPFPGLSISDYGLGFRVVGMYGYKHFYSTCHRALGNTVAI